MRERVVCGAFAALFTYVAAATFVFEWRHPWTTPTERMVYLPSALMFRTVPYAEMRPRESATP
jgi:hypothetical protein